MGTESILIIIKATCGDRRLKEKWIDKSVLTGLLRCETEKKLLWLYYLLVRRMNFQRQKMNKNGCFSDVSNVEAD